MLALYQGLGSSTTQNWARTVPGTFLLSNPHACSLTEAKGPLLELKFHESSLKGLPIAGKSYTGLL